VQWPDWTKDLFLFVLGVLATAICFFWRRKVERTPVFENIDKAGKLLALRKELDSTNYTIQDLQSLEEALMGRAEAAKELGKSFEEEARQIRELESKGALTQVELNEVAGRAYRRAEQRPNKVVDQLKEYFSPDESVDFDRAHAAWRKYQMQNAEFLAARYEGGSIQPLIHASALESAAIARIVELEAALNFAKEALVPYKERDSP
jgi:uncharacterized protein YecT (DUF1311 family)